MSKKQMTSRRNLLKAGAATAGAVALSGCITGTAEVQAEKIARKGRIRQGICGGCLRKTKLSLEEKCKLAAELGVLGMDFMGVDSCATLKKYGLVPTIMRGAGGIKKGLNINAKHPQFLEDFKKNIKAAAGVGCRNVICMAGDREIDGKKISDKEGMDNCAVILRQAVKIAEDHDVTICMELLNSKVTHPGYMCDYSNWGFELCKRVGSPRFKLLYDIYHMQIMEGNLIATITKNIDMIGHFHTAGCPGRHELDENQEIQYPAVMRAIVATGYKGFVSHEYTPVHDPIQSLKQALQVCDV